MITKQIKLNPAQQQFVVLRPRVFVAVWGRGTGKSFIQGYTDHTITRTMPRSVTAVTGQTYTQIYTRTLPSSLKMLEQLGYKKNQHYKIGKPPPDSWIGPHEHLTKFDNVISMINGTAFTFYSQDVKGSGRGGNTDYEKVDEALTLDKESYDQEVSATNRGNNEHFGPLSGDPVWLHHGFSFVSSMPYSAKGKWLLDYADYYKKEAGIDLFNIWNKIVKLQVEMINLQTPKEFHEAWNEVVEMKKNIKPFVSKGLFYNEKNQRWIIKKELAGILFTLANAFDNIQNLGLSYLRNQFSKLPNLIFLIEIMNYVLSKVEDGYYNIDEHKHIYYNASNVDHLIGIAENTDYNIEALSQKTCKNDLDCDDNEPLELSFDWGAHISLMCVQQERGIDFVTGLISRCHNFINEFFVKPGATPSIMIYDLIKEFTDYYSAKSKKVVVFNKDKHGDAKSAASSKTYNELAIEQLEKSGWSVNPQIHTGQEPPQHEKYLLWQFILSEKDSIYPHVRFNGEKCKFTLISMNNTTVEDKDGKFMKNKSSEKRNSGVSPEEATHFSDAADKGIWIKYGELLKNFNSVFIPARFGR